jgi:hypothetical protein
MSSPCRSTSVSGASEPKVGGVNRLSALARRSPTRSGMGRVGSGGQISLDVGLLIILERCDNDRGKLADTGG